MSADPEPATVVLIRPLPSGTVTFIFTDIEGSTERSDRDRTAMELAVRRHDELVRSAIVAHGGHVFKTLGDAFCAAFTPHFLEILSAISLRATTSPAHRKPRAKRSQHFPRNRMMRM